jgi:hypothetical protein
VKSVDEELPLPPHDLVEGLLLLHYLVT